MWAKTRDFDPVEKSFILDSFFSFAQNKIERKGADIGPNYLLL